MTQTKLFITSSQCHGFYGCIKNKFESSSLIYTMDGFGDGANGTVSIYEPGKKIVEISSPQIVTLAGCIDMQLLLECDRRT